MASNPTFLLAPGNTSTRITYGKLTLISRKGFHIPAHYEPLMSALSAKGYNAIAVSMASIGPFAANGQAYDDPEAIQNEAR